MFNNSFERIPDSVERPKEKLDRLMVEMSSRVNNDLGVDILKSDASVNFEKWSDIYGDEEISDDILRARNKELEWSAATNDRTRDFYKKQHEGEESWKCEGEKLTQKIVDAFIEKRESSNPALLEKAVTVIFHKVLGDKFVVMRSSKHDDYENGIDNIIVNKETGDVVCAFDEVHGETKHGGVERKEEKIKRKAHKGGARIKYGLTFENDENGVKKMVKKEIANVPTFFLSMEPQDLREVLKNMSSSLEDDPSLAELKVFNQFIVSLENQINILSVERLPLAVSKNIESFKKSLDIIKNSRDNFN